MDRQMVLKRVVFADTKDEASGGVVGRNANELSARHMAKKKAVECVVMVNIGSGRGKVQVLHTGECR